MQGENASAETTGPDAARIVEAPEAMRGVGEKIVEQLKTVFDPEIPVDIYELGLVYGIDVTPEGEVTVRMTLTSPSCPAAEMIPPEVEQKVAAVEGVTRARAEIVWEPIWNKEMMSESAKLRLGFF
jgi:FeS assembly SUF system protein